MASAHIALASIHSSVQGRLGKMVFSWVAMCPDKTSVYKKRGEWILKR